MIEPFRARFEVLVHDQRGLGRTEIPPGPYSMKDYAADAPGAAGLRRLVVVSGGRGQLRRNGRTGVRGHLRRDRVERLVLACTSPGGAGRSSYPLHELGPARRSDCV